MLFTACTTPAQEGNKANTNTSKYKDDLLALSKIYLKYNTNGSTNPDAVKAALANIKNEELEYVKQFIYEITQQSNNLLSSTFMKKPSKETLQAIYQMRFINWNSMSVEPVTTAVLDKLDMSTVNNEELVSAYYRMLYSGIQMNLNRQITFDNINIDLNKLGLTNNRENAIVFYCGADIFARKYNSSLRSKIINCKTSVDLANTFPKFNGKPFFEATPPPFDDFKITIGNGAKDKSFKTYFVASYDKAVAHFRKCRELAK